MFSLAVSSLSAFLPGEEMGQQAVPSPQIRVRGQVQGHSEVEPWSAVTHLAMPLIMPNRRPQDRLNEQINTFWCHANVYENHATLKVIPHFIIRIRCCPHFMSFRHAGQKSQDNISAYSTWSGLLQAPFSGRLFFVFTGPTCRRMSGLWRWVTGEIRRWASALGLCRVCSFWSL